MSGLLEASERNANLSKGELNKFRKQGTIPAVIFGKGMDSVPVFVNLIEFRNMFQKNGKIFEIKFGANKETVNAKQIDTTPLGQISHIAFHKLMKGQVTTVLVPVTIEGESVGEKAGGMIQQLEDNITISAMPKDIPESIHLDISALDIGDSITAKDIKLPKGMTLDEGEVDKIVVNCQAPQKQEEEPVEAVAAEGDAPAVEAASDAPAASAEADNKDA